MVETDTTMSQVLSLSRKIYTQDSFNNTYTYEKEHAPPMNEKLRKTCTCSLAKIVMLIDSFFPVVRFFRTYKVREYIIGDFLGGLTTSFMHFPQGMGLSILASLRPIHGLYTSFYPVLVYLVFGTSPHVSLGGNAVMSLLTREVIEREVDGFLEYRKKLANTTGENIVPSDDEILEVRVKTSMACCVMSGLFLIVMGVLRLGFLTTYISASFVGGFTTAAAIHIGSSQIPPIFGIHAKNVPGAGKLVIMYIDMFKNIKQTNWVEILLSIVSAAILLLVKVCINERYSTKMKMPVPIDLIVVIVGTMISHFAKLNDIVNVQIVGTMPSTLAAPALPRFKNAETFISNTFVMAIVSLIMSISIAKVLANKHGNEIDDNQEMIAYGASNFISGFFHCFPNSTAPPRSMLLSSLGARTTLNALPTCVVTVLVILVIGPLFTSLPLSVLATVIVVSMKDLLLQYRNLPHLWRVNRIDCIIWLVTNLVGVFVDLSYGIIAGVGISIFLVIVQDQLRNGTLLRIAKDEDILLRQTRHGTTRIIPNIKIFEIPTNLYFATADIIKSQIYTKLLNPKRKSNDVEIYIDDDTDHANATVSVVSTRINMEITQNNIQRTHLDETIVNVIIIDFSSVHYIDVNGLTVLKQIITDYRKVNIEVYFTGIRETALQKMETDGVLKLLSNKHVYLDVFDVLAAIKTQENQSTYL